MVQQLRKEFIMLNFIIGCVLGFFVATVGFSGVIQSLDKGVDIIKSISVSVEKQ